MTGQELSGTLAAILFAAVMVGWVLHWIWCLLSRATGSERATIADLEQRLDRAEQARHAAEAGAQQAAEAYDARILELETALADQAAAHEADREVQAAEQARLLDEATREAAAAWDGLGLARRRIAELERVLEDK